MGLTHFNEEGRARMVDVGQKEQSDRIAIATGKIYMAKETIEKIEKGELKKGDVLAVAQVAGIMAAKKTSELIPMCHPLFLTGIDISFQIEKDCIGIKATVKNHGKTGVEMEALTAATVTALTIYDMCKAIDKEMVISEVSLLEKIGGKSGNYIRRS
ncbi:MAG: moaC [Clostridia bacterium]|jgi:cyclic pyranopterin phosphate synthase|nr:moaC [Clostridia bacterium]